MDESLNKKEAEILDTIIETVLKNGVAYPESLPALTTGFLSDFKELKNRDYKYYVDLIKKYNVVIVNSVIGDGFQIQPIAIITDNFYKEGGFKNLFEKQQKQVCKNKEIEEITYEKLKWELKLSKWQAKTFWYVFFLGLIGGICGFVSLGLQLNDRKISGKQKIEKSINPFSSVDSLIKK